MPTISKLFSTGILQTSVVLDEVTYGSIKVSPTGVYAAEFDEFTGAPVVDSSLQLWLDAGQTSSYSGTGTTWTDLSGNSRTGTLTSGPTYSSANGGSIVFDGTNDYVELINDSRTQFTNKSQATIEAWVNASSFSGTGNRFIYSQFFSGGNTSCGIFINTSGKLVFGYRDTVQQTGGSLKTLTSNTTH